MASKVAFDNAVSALTSIRFNCLLYRRSMNSIQGTITDPQLACNLTHGLPTALHEPNRLEFELPGVATVSLVPLRSRTVPETKLRFLSASSWSHFRKISYILFIDAETHYRTSFACS